MRKSLTVLMLQDARARVTRISEFVQDGELETAAIALEDLGDDLWKFLETLSQAEIEAGFPESEERLAA